MRSTPWRIWRRCSADSLRRGRTRLARGLGCLLGSLQIGHSTHGISNNVSKTNQTLLDRQHIRFCQNLITDDDSALHARVVNSAVILLKAITQAFVASMHVCSLSALPRGFIWAWCATGGLRGRMSESALASWAALLQQHKLLNGSDGARSWREPRHLNGDAESERGRNNSTAREADGPCRRARKRTSERSVRSSAFSDSCGGRRGWGRCAPLCAFPVGQQRAVRRGGRKGAGDGGGGSLDIPSAPRESRAPVVNKRSAVPGTYRKR